MKHVNKILLALALTGITTFFVQNLDASSTRNITAQTITNGTGVLTLPTSTDTILGRNTTDTLTNKSISGSSNTLSNVGLSTQVTGTLPIANGGTNATSKAAAFDSLSPMTTSGDITYGAASGTGTRLAKGSDGQVLTLASGIPSWATGATTYGDCHVRLDSGNGYGSTNTSIRRFTNSSVAGSCITYADSAANGGTLTTTEAGWYHVDYSYKKSASGVNAGITVNQSGLTTTPDALTIANGSTGYQTCSTNTGDFCTIGRTFYLGSGDIVRLNANANIANDSLEYVYMGRVSR